MVQPNAVTTALDPLLQRGAGYRLPVDTAYQPLEEKKKNAVTADDIVDAVEYFHDAGAHPRVLCFGGGRSEPMESLEVVIEAMREVRERRHGLPMVIQTNGLHPSEPFSDNGDDHVEALSSLHQEWASAPGSDGDSKLSVWVNVAASNPNEYGKVMQPEVGGPQGFGQVCDFVARLAESGTRVVATASAVPGTNMDAVRDVSIGLGCTEFFTRSYHPKTLYDVLGIQLGDTAAEIRAAYLQKAKEMHPDLHQGKEPEGMVAVVEANSILGDEKLREQYDRGVADMALNTHEDDIFSSVVNKSI